MSWDITEIEPFFKAYLAANHPNQVIRLKQHGMGEIKDLNKFIDSHLVMCKANNKKHKFEPYYLRLVEVKNILELEQT